MLQNETRGLSATAATIADVQSIINQSIGLIAPDEVKRGGKFIEVRRCHL